MEKFIVDNLDAKKRIDAYLANKTGLSRVNIQRLIEDSKISVNGSKTKPSYKVQKDDVILMEKEEVKEISLKPQEIPLEILYEDNDIIVVNKPKGLVVHPANRKPRWNISKCYYGYL